MSPCELATATDNVALARKWAELYRLRGLNPLPSRTDDKRPNLPSYREYWDAPLPAEVYDRAATTNIQIMTGRRWRLLVIDLDGPEAIERWAGLVGPTPPTWVTHSGGGGRHVWFRLPAGIETPLPKAFLWKGDGEHRAIERLCDKSLVMAPPSIHPKTGNRYRFLDQRHSPKRLPLPADCPARVLRLRPVDSRPTVVPSPLRPVVPAPRRAAAPSPSRRYDRSEVLAAIPDKIGLARSWGVRFEGRDTGRGWLPCHAIDRPDANPSAAVHIESGNYVDLGSGAKLSLFDLGVSLGQFADFREAIDQLGTTHVR